MTVSGEDAALQLASWEQLDARSERQNCQVCGRKRMYFCYDCHVNMQGIEEIAPKVKLPVAIDIIKHKMELNSKSTAIHCQLLAPEATRIFNGFDDLPDYSACAASSAENGHFSGNTVIVFPSKTAVSIDEFVQRNGPIERFVFLDATWNNVGSCRALKQIRKMPYVSLTERKTKYWRPQKGMPDTCLATIEAIYYAILEHRDACDRLLPEENRSSYDGRYDNLLFWF
ncbi:Protein Y53C12A.10, partial [Aphelenchoides avenae]